METALFHPVPYCQITFITTDTATLGWGWGHLAFFSLNQILCFLSPRSAQAQERKRLLITCPSFVLGLVSPSVCFLQVEPGSGLWSACFYLFLTNSHKADIPLCWARGCWNQRSESPGAPWCCWVDFSPTLPLSCKQRFPEINKSLWGYMNLRLSRETLIKQLNYQSEVTLKLSLPET